MSESNTQHQTPYPRGSGAGVPVLFSLKNVQPTIVAGGLKDKSNNAKPTQETNTGLPSAVDLKASQSLQDASPVPAPAMATQPMAKNSVSPTKTSNRLYNSTILFLVIALCFLVVRNALNQKSQSISKSDAPSTPTLVTGDTTQIPAGTNTSSPMMLGANNERPAPLEIAPPALPASDPVKTQTQDVAELNQTSGTPALLVSSSNTVGSENDPAAPLMISPSNSQPQVTAKPAMMPTLLSEPSHPFPSQTPTTVAPEQGPPSEPAATEVELETVSNAIPMSPPAVASQPSIVDTGVNLTTRDLIVTYQANTAGTDPRSVTPTAGPVMPQNTSLPRSVSQLPASEQPNSQWMSGQSYPAPTKEYVPLHIPPYEQNAMNSKSPTATNATVPPSTGSPAIRQPYTNYSNRYNNQGGLIQQPTSAPAPASYVPIGTNGTSQAPNIGGNSTGYPPAN